ncbi:hypothetical protein [Streptococcus orisratti]
MEETPAGLKKLAENTKQDQAQKVLLSVKELENLGSELTDIMNRIELNNLTLEGFEFAQGKDTTASLWLVRKYIDITYAQNEKLIDKLDNIAFLLLNSNNAVELEAVKNDR